ncbi:hypothetical protein CLV32_4066 [Pedobacter duraquae]|uniref:Uncharacterized protein n=2 Tax=Pedobacter duraquae TaxID=425511 RepID=A0A4R6IEW5_9SPHI|nr:hypothetical protein CLV32_4066 [Pedobacter duraquae]
MLVHTKLLLIVGSVLILLSACQLFKKTTTDNTAEKIHSAESTNLTAHELNSEQLSRQIVAVKNDSALVQTSLTIWPRGPFKFSADSGFTGTAERIQLTTSTKTGSAQAGKETLKKHTVSVADKKVSAKATADKSSTKKAKVSSPEAFPYLVIGVIIIALMITLAGYLIVKAR